MINQCTRCIMDDTAAGFHLGESGECNYCTEFERNGTVKDIGNQHDLLKLVPRNPNTEYDCVVGVSGGVDSSWVLVKAVELGLRPLAVHMDNGWNSELSQNNIANLVKALDVDMYTHVIDWSEYKGLMQSFFNADVIDIELLTDNALLEVNYSIAKKFGINTILGGTNRRTEGMRMPSNWGWFKMDGRNIRDIGRVSGITRLKTFPLFTYSKYIAYKYVSNIQWVSALDYLDYQKDVALSSLTRHYGYKPYPYKHYESIFTRFYQGHILPEKFNVDKRKLHLSTLIMSGQLTRNAAKVMMEQSPYPNQCDLLDDTDYFIRKMGWSMDDLKQYLARPEQRHDRYKSELWKFSLAKKIKAYLSK